MSIKTVTPKQKAAKKSVTTETAKVSSSDRVVDGIKQHLVSGRLVPGQKLIEADLTRAFNLSRGPIREALKKLAAEGVITLTLHRGAFIRAFNREELHEMLVILEYLVGLMARLAATAVKEGNDPSPLHEAYDLLSPYKEQGIEALDFIGRRKNFYETLVSIGRNHQLARVMPSMEIAIIRAQFLPYMTHKEHAARLNEYAAITTAVLDGDPKKAEKTGRKHIVETRKRFSKLPDEAFPVLQ
jgi:DNA-binding GntR family transcriptional regulator